MQRGGGHAGVPDTVVEYAIAVPVAVFILMLWGLHRPLVPEVVIRPLKTGVAIALVLLLPLASPVIGLAGVVIGIAIVAGALVAVTLVDNAARERKRAATRR